MRDSNRIFLHFFDREAGIASGHYYYTSVAAYINVFKVCYILSYERMVLSGGHLFEHKAAVEMLKNYGELIYRGDVIPVGEARNTEEFIRFKSSQYSHTRRWKERDYSIYQKDEWKKLITGPVNFIIPSRNTTEELAKRMLAEIQEAGGGDEIANVINERGGRAITVALFRDIKGIRKYKYTIDLPQNISRNYQAIYRDLYGDYIFSETGLIDKSLEVESGREYRYPIYAYIYRVLGLGRIFRDGQFAEAMELRGSIEHIRFINSIRSLAHDLRADEVWRLGVIFGGILQKEDYGQDVRKSLDEQFYSIANCLDRCGILDDRRAYQSIEYGNLYRGWKMPNVNDVFVVHGRDEKARKSVFSLLRAFGLNPLEWEEAVALTHSSAPYIGDVIATAMQAVRGIVIILSPDEDAVLAEELQNSSDTKRNKKQPRPNVIFEAGMAIGKYEDRAIVVKVGDVDVWSDLSGRHYIALSNDIISKQNFKARLSRVGYRIDDGKSDWISIPVEYTKRG